MSNSININELPSIRFSRRSKLPDCCAIYFALSPEGDILYIGKAIRLNMRWQNHHQAKTLLNRGCAYIAWHECEKGDLNNLEKKMIAKFNPLLNSRKGTSNHFLLRFPSPSEKRMAEEWAERAGYSTLTEYILTAISEFNKLWIKEAGL